MPEVPPYPFAEINELVDQHPRYKQTVSNVAPRVIGGATSLITGHELAGRAAKAAATAAASAAPDAFAKTVTHVGFCAGMVALNLVLAPIFPFILLGVWLFSGGEKSSDPQPSPSTQDQAGNSTVPNENNDGAQPGDHQNPTRCLCGCGHTIVSRPHPIKNYEIHPSPMPCLCGCGHATTSNSYPIANYEG